MRDYITGFLSYLRIEKFASPLTLYQYRLELEKLSNFLFCCNILSPSNITTPLIRKYIYNVKEKRNLSDTSICKLIAIIKSFFNFLEEEETIVKNPTRKIKTPKKNKTYPKVISRYEIDQILKSIKFAPQRCKKNYTRDKLIISMLYFTGIRRGELLNLNWDDLNLSKSTIIIRSGKGRNDRIMPLHPKLIALIDEYLALRLPLNNNAMFIGEMGRRLSKHSFAYLLKIYLNISCLSNKNYTAHSFRHSFATHLIEKGVDIFKVQTLLGHSSLDSTRIYINFNSSQIAKAVLNL